MGNIYDNPDRLPVHRKLRALAYEVLREQGYEILPGSVDGKSSVRHIRRGGKTFKASIRASTKTEVAFPRLGDSWRTLPDVDFVVSASTPKDDFNKASIYIFPSAEVMSAFNRSRDALEAAGLVVKEGYGLWLPLHGKEDPAKPRTIGRGLGDKYPAVQTVDLREWEPETGFTDEGADGDDAKEAEGANSAPPPEMPLSIQEAKRRLALTFGVTPDAIKITIEG